MKKKVVYLHPEEVQGIVNMLRELPIKYTNTIVPIVQLLNSRNEMLIEVDITDSGDPEILDRKPIGTRARKSKDGNT